MIDTVKNIVKNFFIFRDLNKDDSYPKIFNFNVAMVSILTFGTLSVLSSIIDDKYKYVCLLTSMIMVTSLFSDSYILENNTFTEIAKKIDVVFIALLTMMLFITVNKILFTLSFIAIIYLYRWKKRINKFNYEHKINTWHILVTLVLLAGIFTDFYISPESSYFI